jgi:Flp pilus assembly protein TadG
VLADDRGNAIIEFVFVAVIVMVPLVYFVVCVADVQRSSIAVGQAAREAGRAFATGSSAPDGLRRAEVAARLALDDQGVGGAPALSFHTRPDCTSLPVAPTLTPGAEYTVCVTRSVQIPGVPTVLAGRGVRTVGRYLLHVDDFRSSP